MELTLPVNYLAVFEWHCTPRLHGQIVMANIPEFGLVNDSTEAVKQPLQDGDDWFLDSDKSYYKQLRVSKTT
jgi:hypothetical protein